jgi:hypothetical protein
MPPRVTLGAPVPRWRAVLFGVLVVVAGTMLTALGAFAAGGTTVRCARDDASVVTCEARSTRWLGRSELSHDPIGGVRGVSTRVTERSERDPDSRNAANTTRTRTAWYLVLERTHAAPWEVGGTREQIEEAAARLRELVDDPARRGATASVHDWGFAWAAMAMGALVTMLGVRILVRAR